MTDYRDDQKSKDQDALHKSATLPPTCEVPDFHAEEVEKPQHSSSLVEHENQSHEENAYLPEGFANFEAIKQLPEEMQRAMLGDLRFRS